jgi:WD40 repeat protein
MPCRTCGTPLEGDPAAPWCPKCSFERALTGCADPRPGGSIEQEPFGGAYELLHQLGRGSMGVVWLARECALDRLVALKVAAPGADPAWSARLLREGKAVASLRHPNVVAVHALGGEGHTAFLSMEFVEGGSLDARIAESPLPFRDSALIAERLAGALAYAHASGLIHRDIKPSNILMGDNSEPRLADFGLVAPIEGAGDLTLPGHIAGTPAYLAPEILGGSDRASPASDIYGLGAVLYSCLTRRAPFIGESIASILTQLPTDDPPPPHLLLPGVPRDLETICLKCLEKNPVRRYASAALLEADLRSYREGRPIAARPVGFAGKLARSCRRHPALALSVTISLLLLLALAIGGPLMALRLAKARASAEERLRESLLARSRATRLAAQIGQRNESLAAATEAAKIRPGLDSRDEVIAALARPEVVPIRSWPVTLTNQGVVSFDPDNDLYVSERAPGQLDLRRMSDNSLLRAWTGPSDDLRTEPVMSADGHTVVDRSLKGTVSVWSLDRAEPIFKIEGRPYVLGDRFTGYGQPDALTPDGKILASAKHGGGVTLNRIGDGIEVGRIPTEVEATHVAFSRDGTLITVGRGILGRDGRAVEFVKVFDSLTLKEVSRLQLDRGFQSIEWSPTGYQLLITGGRLEIYEATTGKRLRSFDDPAAIGGYFGPMGTTLLSVSAAGNITLWDLGAARPLLSGPLGSKKQTAVSRNGELVAKITGEDSAGLYRLEMSRVARTQSASTNRDIENVLSAAVSTVEFSPDGRWIATAIWGSIQLRDKTGTLVATARLGTYSNYCSVKFSRDGRSLLAGTSEEGLLRIPILSLDDGHASLGMPEVIDSETPEFITDISSDGGRALVTSFITGFVKVVPLDGSKSVVRWELPGAAGAAFVDGDRSIVSNSLNFTGHDKVEVRDAATGSRVEKTLAFDRGAHVTVSKDGSLMVLGSGANRTVLLHPSDWTQGADLPPNIQGRGIQCALSRDGRTIAFGAGVQTWLVNAADGSVLAHLESAQGGTYIPGLAFSPDGNELAVWWDNGQLTVWDLALLHQELKPRGLDW